MSDLLAARLLIAYHLEHQRPMMGAFLDLLGIAHEDGLIKDEDAEAARRRDARQGGRGAVGEVSEGRRRALFLGAALAGSRDVGRTEGPARTGARLDRSRSVTVPWRRSTNTSSSAATGASRATRAAAAIPTGSEALQKAFKKALAERGINRRIRANKSGCLDQCEKGPTVVVYPDDVWYGGVTEADVNEIVERAHHRRRPVDAAADACVNTALSASPRS